MDTFICNFCNKTFVSKSNLNTHIATAKYCISKRNNICLPSGISENKIIHKCNFCNKVFTSKKFLGIHITKCKNKTLYEEKTSFEKTLQQNSNIYEEKLQEQKILYEQKLQEQKILYDHLEESYKQKIQEKDNLISIFKEQLDNLQEKLATKPTNINNTTNTTTNNITQILTPFVLNDDDISKIVDNLLDERYFLDAQKGIAKFCVDNILKDDDGKMRMVCTDPVRERFKYLDENGIIKEDIQARNFIEKLYPPLYIASEKLYCKIIDRYNKIKEKIENSLDNSNNDLYRVNIKIEAADKALIDITLIRNVERNKNFRKELAYKTNV